MVKRKQKSLCGKRDEQTLQKLASDLTVEQVLEIVLGNLAPEERDQSIVFWDEKPVESGAPIKIGRESLEMPFKGYMAFVDLMPKANWGHPCLYFLIDAKTHDIQIRKEAFPPYYGEYPQSYRVILRYGKSPPHARYFQVFDETN